MITCPKCDAHYATAQCFCSNCGHHLANRCAYCGGAYLDEDTYCGQCGQQLNAPDLDDQIMSGYNNGEGRSSDFYQKLIKEAERDKKLFAVSASNLSRKAIDSLFHKNEGSEQ